MNDWRERLDTAHSKYQTALAEWRQMYEKAERDGTISDPNVSTALEIAGATVELRYAAIRLIRQQMIVKSMLGDE